jgi:hypothetical protein
MKSLLWSPRFVRRVSDGTVAVPPGVHVIRGDSAAGALKQAGARPLVCIGDTLTVGPSDLAPARHARLRHRFWRTEYCRVERDWPIEDDPTIDLALLSTRDLVARVLEDARGRVVLWGSGSWADLLFLAWAVVGFRREKFGQGRLSLAAPLTQSAPLGWANPDQLKPIGAAAQPLGTELEEALVSLWDAFTFSDPSQLEALRSKPPAMVPTLQRSVALYASFLPRRQGSSRRLRLSAVDVALLASLSEREFRGLPDVLRTRPSRARWPASAVFAMLSHFGEVFIEARLAKWTEGRNRAVEPHVVRAGADVRYRTAWRLTAFGRALLARGIEDASSVPDFAIGGYDSSSTAWVTVEGGRGWRMEPLGRRRAARRRRVTSF